MLNLNEFETHPAQERVIRSFERCEYARGEVVVKQGNEVTWGQMGNPANRQFRQVHLLRIVWDYEYLWMYVYIG